jgi:hypothetical protein
VGRVVYERLPDQQLQGFDDDVVSELIFPVISPLPPIFEFIIQLGIKLT